MEIQLERREGYSFTARGPSDHPISVTASDELAGQSEGVRSMEMVAMGLAGCSSIDIVRILEKQRQTLTDYRVELDARRAEDETPAVFRDLHVHVIMEGDVEPHKAQRAVELTLSTYCSVAQMLEKTAEIRYSLTVNGDEVARRLDYD